MVTGRVYKENWNTKSDKVDFFYIKEKVEHILEKFHGDKIHVIPNLAGSLPNNCFTDILNIPTIWIPHSYKECSQHAPNDHGPNKLFREARLLMTNLYWNLGKND